MGSEKEPRFCYACEQFDIATNYRSTNCCSSKIFYSSKNFCLNIIFSPSHFSRVTHLSLYFPSNFGSETTRIYYIGLRGEYLGVSNAFYVIFYDL